MELFKGAQLKIEQASNHIGNFELQAHKFFESAKCELVVEKDADSDDRFVLIKLVDRYPEKFRLTIGDALSNLRSALDHLAVGLAKQHTGEHHKIYFPIKNDKGAFEREVDGNKLQHFSGDTIEKLKLFQPFQGGNCLLWAIHHVRNYENHNFLVPISDMGSLQLVSRLNLHFRSAKTAIFLGGSSRLDQGIILSNLGEKGELKIYTNEESKIHVKGHFAFGDIDPISNLPVLPTLNSMVNETQTIFDKLTHI